MWRRRGGAKGAPLAKCGDPMGQNGPKAKARNCEAHVLHMEASTLYVVVYVLR